METQLSMTGNPSSSQEHRFQLRLGQVSELIGPQYPGFHLAFDFDEFNTGESNAEGRPAEVVCRRTIGEGLSTACWSNRICIVAFFEYTDTLTGCISLLVSENVTWKQCFV